jgi:hypothetical protein
VELRSAECALTLNGGPPPARGAPPPPRPDPPSTAAALLSVRLGRHRATGADPATASRQSDHTWQPPHRATTPQPPRHLPCGPLCSRHWAVSSWLQTLIRYSCLNLNACEDAICRADKPRASRLFRGKEFAIRSSGPNFVRDAVFFRLFTSLAPTPPHPAQATRRHALVARPKPKSSGPLCSSRSSQCGQLLLLPPRLPRGLAQTCTINVGLTAMAACLFIPPRPRQLTCKQTSENSVKTAHLLKQ